MLSSSFVFEHERSKNDIEEQLSILNADVLLALELRCLYFYPLIEPLSKINRHITSGCDNTLHPNHLISKFAKLNSINHAVGISIICVSFSKWTLLGGISSHSYVPEGQTVTNLPVFRYSGTAGISPLSPVALLN